MESNLFYRSVKWLAALIFATWTSIPHLVQLLIVFMALDLATGILVAIIKKEVSSDVSFGGVAKKALVLILVGMSHIASDTLHTGVDLGSVVALAYCANEVISITENCARAGIPIPGPLVDILAKFKGKTKTQAPEDLKT